MNELAGYKITGTIYVGTITKIYRGMRTHDGRAVLLKVLEDYRTNPGEHERLLREYEMLRSLNVEGAAKAYALEREDSRLAVVLEDNGGVVLSAVAARRRLSVEEGLKAGISLSETLGRLHRSGIIHRDINPSNILWNEETGKALLMGFGAATTVPSQETHSAKSIQTLEGTLAYMSPEQTGRMNRLVDYRTDFYSLGVTLYQILSGKLPFEAKDALEMVHSHIARVPAAPHEVNPDVPQMVSKVVMKLMAKTAEDRYQSAWGLKADLEKCLHEFTTTGRVSSFETGLKDFPEQFRISQKLYGREKEVERLLGVFERTSGGQAELFLVAGYAGVGKTSLVHEIYKPVTSKRGYFIEGKFDQLQRNVPYTGWIQSFSALVDNLLMESELELEAWKKDILDAVGGVGKVLTDVIPSLKLIIGSQPEVPVLGAVEAQNRFNYVFRKFAGVFAKKEHPLVVFLDDLQWVDLASLSLLHVLLGGKDISSFLLIGAYRDNEVDALHPLIKSVEQLQKEKTSVEKMTLGNLLEDDVNVLIADTLYRTKSETLPLAQLIYSKTAGNAFFTHQTLKSLADKKALYFDFDRHLWNWDMNAIRAMAITDNVVVLMVTKIEELPPRASYTGPCFLYRKQF